MVRLRTRAELYTQRPAEFWARCAEGKWNQGTFVPGHALPVGIPLENIVVWVPADEFNAATAA